MKKLSAEQRERSLRKLAAMPDDQIDTSDIPELTREQFKTGVRGLFYRPIKKPVTLRLDADVIAWLKKDGRGYQTKANALLRKEMIRALQPTKKGPEQVSSGTRTTKRVRNR